MVLPLLYTELLVRPQTQNGESQWGFWLRLARENGLQRPQWLLSPGLRISSARTRVCPECLREANAVYRQDWDGQETYWCTRHHTWLVDQCPSCHRHLRWSGIRFLECACSYDLRNIDTVVVDRRILTCVDTGSTSLAVLRTLGAFSLHGSTGKPGKKTDRAAISHVRPQIEAGVDVIEGWPKGFICTLDRHRNPTSACGTAQLLVDAFPRLKHMVKLIYDDAWRERIESEINAYCSRSISSSKPILGRNTLLRQTPMTLKQIAIHLGCRVELAARAIDQQGQVGPPIRTTAAGRRRRVVGEGALPQLATTLRDPIETKKAARIMALPSTRIRALVRAGFLVETDGRLSRSQVVALDADLRCRIGERIEEHEALAFPVRQALRNWVRIERTAGFFLALRAGELNARATSDQSPVGDWEISKATVADWVASLHTPMDGAMSLTQAAEALTVKHDVVRDLIKVGLLNAQNVPFGGRQCRALEAAEIANFKMRYMALAELTKAANVRARDGFTWAIAQGMVVVTGPRVDGSRQYFVERNSTRFA